MKLSNHILVIRFSAPGDVAMLVPVLHSFQDHYPSVKITIVTNAKLADLFQGLRVQFIFAETKGKHKGIAGLFRLFREIKKNIQCVPVDAVADMHGVLRSIVLQSFFTLSGVQTVVIDKGRKEKKELVRKDHKVLKQLPTSFERYRSVFCKLGFEFPLSFTSLFKQMPALPGLVKQLTGDKKTGWIGIAPFAAHKYKMYPPEKMKQVAEKLYQQKYQLFFFGAENEASLFDEWQQQMPGSVNVAGVLNLSDELKLMAWLDCMISMDSANMHFASLVNVPVVSVWGATHPYAGFLGWGQKLSNTVQTELNCRPCSVFGNRECYRKDFACMQSIIPNVIAEKVRKIVAQ